MSDREPSPGQRAILALIEAMDDLDVGGAEPATLYAPPIDPRGSDLDLAEIVSGLREAAAIRTGAEAPHNSVEEALSLEEVASAGCVSDGAVR